MTVESGTVSGFAAMSPALKARIAGAIYLLNIVTGAVAAANMGRDLGDAANLAATVAYLIVTFLFYDLFKPVSPALSAVAALFSLIGCALGAVRSLHLADLPVNNLVFFGVYCLLIGYLVFQSDFLPKILGVLMAIGGIGWMTFLSPALANRLAPYNLAPGVIGESALTLWLLITGVNVRRWQERAGRPVV